MSTFPDFSTHGYQVTRELGYNSLGGRVTYLATKINTTNSVVIKQFQFAQLGASWAEYDAYEQEIKVLKQLAHPGIPRYLDAFGTDSGFCMVQEYKNAESAIDRTFAPPDIKQIAIATLEILAYLQSQKPPVIHRDIKPENLLIDEELNVYLVDFGFARLGGGNIAASSIVKGTMGFMPPEQMFNRKLTKASDLYGLGITLICLLTGTKSADVGNLIDANYGIHFRHLVPPLQQGWMNWLERMVAPRIQDRYQSAADALAALESLDVSSLPKVRLERDRLEFTATEYGEKIIETIEISNPIPDIILAGRWEVAAHPSDPPHTPYDHPWISFEPQKFESNKVACKVIVDTQQLLASQTYERHIILYTNSEPDTYQLKIKVTTAPLPLPELTTLLSKGSRNLFLCGFLLCAFLFSMGDESYMAFGIIASLVYGFAVAEVTILAESNGKKKTWVGGLFGSLIGLIFYFWAFGIVYNFNKPSNTILSIAASIVMVIGPIFFILAGAALGSMMNRALAMSLAIIVQLVFFVFFILVGMWIAEGYSTGFFSLLINLCCMIVYTIFQNPDEQTTLIRIVNIQDNTRDFLMLAFCTSLVVAFKLFFNVVAQREWVEPMEIVAVGVATIASLAVTGIPLLEMVVFKPKRILAKYRKSEQSLIKP
ncbi:MULTISPECIES: bifunctional serine/threonine protein kinase/MFS transporter [unclassified Microcoleus]|uniref:bifunctional serine/threonine protein kinase/MFS transporter n=1 Tax=unclassified Microcoleus TaxID=2642155 RepID=UPI002FD6D36E